MANRAVIAGIVLVAAGGAAAAWFLSGPRAESHDAAARGLLKDVADERQKDPVDRESCRKLLGEFRAHPEHSTSRDLIRGRAWLELLIGRSVRAWDLLEPNLDVDATTEDELLGSRILERRFADSGDGDLAHRGSTLAQSHFHATNEKSSLFLAWQLQVRREDVDRRAELGRLLVEQFPGSIEARLVKVLVNYPGLREETPGAQEELRKLENEFPVIPVELDLALAWFEIEQTGDALQSCLDRVERVLQTFQSSITARSLGGMVAARLGEWKKSKAWLEALLRQHPEHAARNVWRTILAHVDAELAKKNG